MDFISDMNMARHKEAAGRDILRLGILERSIPEVASAEPKELLRMRKRGTDMHAVAELKASVTLHRVFFESFSDNLFSPSAAVREAFGSERAFCELMLRRAIGLHRGFAAMVRAEKGLTIAASERALDILLIGEPILAIDLSEHAYYGDFGFDKESYLKSALSHFSLERVEPLRDRESNRLCEL